MKLLSKEHYELMEMFEKSFKKGSFYGRLDKEDKELWSRNIIYQDGNVNNLFLLYREGYIYGKVV